MKHLNRVTDFLIKENGEVEVKNTKWRVDICVKGGVCHVDELTIPENIIIRVRDYNKR